MKPIAVIPKVAFDAIGVGVTKGYELLAAGELESFTIGRSRRITVASIEAFIARRLEAEAA
ncbi:MAG TPA: hypothetical protein VJM34_06910 [Novosphingobium sp.]|nr:hypothetical protein [Novosphingobium sp.]